jgi:hypothetical protein
MDISLFKGFMEGLFYRFGISKSQIQTEICEDGNLKASIETDNFQFVIKDVGESFTLQVNEYVLAFAGVYSATKQIKHTSASIEELERQIESYIK